MGSTAQFKMFGPFFRAGELVAAPRLYHYAAGTLTLLDAYADRAKGSTLTQPIEGDANGIIAGYFDGLYQLVIQTSDGEELLTWDAVDLTESQHRLEAATTWDPAALLPGQGQSAPPITVAGAAFGDYVLVSAPYDLQGMIASARVSGANTVTIRLDRPVSTLSGSLTWNPGALGAGMGELSASITVTGAALGDAVLVHPPYDLQGLLAVGCVTAADTVKVRLYRDTSLLQATAVYDPVSLIDGNSDLSAGIAVTGAVLGDTVLVYPPYSLQGLTVTGYVSAADTVRISVVNKSGGTINLASGTWRVAVLPQASVDLASGSWFVTVLPKPAAIDLPNGGWKVRVLQQ